MKMRHEFIHCILCEAFYEGQDLLLLHLKFLPGKFKSQKSLDAIIDLDELLRDVLMKTKIGEFDGNEFCTTPKEEIVTFYMYGKDANKIQNIIEPIIQSLPKLPGSYMHKTYANKKKTKNEKIYL